MHEELYAPDLFISSFSKETDVEVIIFIYNIILIYVCFESVLWPLKNLNVIDFRFAVSCSYFLMKYFDSNYF